jgi:hypothetical protein
MRPAQVPGSSSQGLQQAGHAEDRHHALAALALGVPPALAASPDPYAGVGPVPATADGRLSADTTMPVEPVSITTA